MDSNTHDFQPEASAEPAPETGATPRVSRTRRGAGRSASRPTDQDANAPAVAGDSATLDEQAQRPVRRSRSRATRPTNDSTAAMAPEPDALTSAEARAEETAPVTTDAASADEEEPARPRRRRRARSGRGNGGENANLDVEESAVNAVTELSSGLDVAPEPAVLAEEPAGLSVAAPGEELVEAPEAPAPGRRRRRRGRGGRGAANGAAGVLEEDTGAALQPDLAAPEPAGPVLEGPAHDGDALSPAILRRFDRRNWRDRGARVPAAPARQAQPFRSAEAPSPLPFGRGDHAERGGRAAPREPFAAADVQAPSPRSVPAIPAATASPDVASIAPPRPAPRVTPPPIAVPPAVAPETRESGGSLASPRALPAGGSLEERIERLLAGQSALLQQHQEMMQALSTTMTALRLAVDRMSTTGIAAGMPRAGVFVDAPNVVYAAESARVNLDYGRMLDFLCRGREMVHAIVYAPVTEDTGYRMEAQRFVAPFLHKGYKLVTKPLKRFPDGTAKGNFDIELAIDIVTMSERLDVVILISGDSDFSRLIELIQSRGVRVEVVAFASNVSWELVQMADVFIDISEYLAEFRA